MSFKIVCNYLLNTVPLKVNLLMLNCPSFSPTYVATGQKRRECTYLMVSIMGGGGGGAPPVPRPLWVLICELTSAVRRRFHCCVGHPRLEKGAWLQCRGREEGCDQLPQAKVCSEGGTLNRSAPDTRKPRAHYGGEQVCVCMCIMLNQHWC